MRRTAKFRPTDLERFEALLFRDIISGCWFWIGATSQMKKYKYSTFWNGEMYVRGHRWAYEHFKGPIPKRFCVHHLCGIRHCVNPEHLEAITYSENVKRGNCKHGGEFNKAKTHCKWGHPLSGKNLYIRTNGRRACRACAYRATRAWLLEKRAARQNPNKTGTNRDRDDA